MTKPHLAMTRILRETMTRFASVQERLDCLHPSEFEGTSEAVAELNYLAVVLRMLQVVADAHFNNDVDWIGRRANEILELIATTTRGMVREDVE